MLTRRKFLEVSGTGIGAAMAARLVRARTLTGLAGGAGEARTLAAIRPHPTDAARGVLERLLDNRAGAFSLEHIPAENDREVYEVAASGGRVTVKGSSGVAISRGAYAYLREACKAMTTWSGRHLSLPLSLPDFPATRVACPYKFVQYYNPCTFGYSTAFWNWDRWQRELDWMALHGITMPLALEGQEAIWNRVWKSMGLTQAELDRFSTGPGHLPWHRMGNINRFDGPLPLGWMDQKRDLQKKILERMRELGMTPIVPAFSGFVPESFKRVYPTARTFTLLWAWNPAQMRGMPRDTETFVLDPAESDKYKEIGRRFIQEYKREFGPVEYYLADTFNELSVPVTAEHRYEELAQFARTVYDGILAGDPNGKWVMQGWLFHSDQKFWDNKSVQAFLSGIPNDRMIILDYANDLDARAKPPFDLTNDRWKALDSYYGKQWINGMAHTFGGNNNVKGNLQLIVDEPAAVLADPGKGNLAGWSMDMEGIETNEVVYELMTDIGWSAGKIDLAKWIPAYCRSRYGDYPHALELAWDLLLQSAYSQHTWKTHHSWQARPSLQPKVLFVDSGPVFQQAVEQFVACGDKLGSNDLYRNDLIELVAQSAGGSADRRLAGACQAHIDGKAEARDRMAGDALDMLLRIDGLMNLRADRRLETWTNAARGWALGPDEAAYYDSNSRRLITFWGWSELQDYASRVWSGLIRDYYVPRWRIFFQGLKQNKPAALDVWEEGWLAAPYQPSQPYAVPDLIREARQMLDACKRWE
jgi:alpha-N-acetylglucosaminidase